MRTFVGLLFVLSLLSAACDSAQLKQAPPTVDSGEEGCSSAPEIDCEAGAPSDDTCTGNATAPGYTGELPTAKSYPTGCQAFFQGADCSTLASCSCTRPGDAGASWVCNQ